VPLGAVWVADQDNEALIKAMYRRLLDPARSSRRFDGWHVVEACHRERAERCAGEVGHLSSLSRRAV